MYLWIDLWDKRCWIAIYIEWIVLPKWIISRHLIVNEIKKLIKEYGIKTLVVGLPYDLYRNDKKQLNKTILFIEKLKYIFPMQKIEWIDERFTSFEADMILDSMWIKNKIWKKDDISAVLILESYLRQNKI